MIAPTSHPLALAAAGQTYRICQSHCSEPMKQKLTLMGLGLGMVIELIALYSHGAVVRTAFGNMAVGSDLTRALVVARS